MLQYDQPAWTASRQHTIRIAQLLGEIQVRERCPSFLLVPSGAKESSRGAAVSMTVLLRHLLSHMPECHRLTRHAMHGGLLEAVTQRYLFLLMPCRRHLFLHTLQPWTVLWLRWCIGVHWCMQRFKLRTVYLCFASQIAS